MHYISTRGQVPRANLSEAILSGIASDGGLYFPETIPKLSASEILEISNLNFSQAAAKIYQLYNSSFSDSDIQLACSDSYNQANFSEPAIAPVRKLNQNLFLLELFHGPTGAFKDFALQFLPRVMQLAIEQGDQKERSILVATSGDTGGAALSGFANVPKTSCIVFFPRDGVSHLQAAQMQSAAGKNVSAITIDSDFDAAQAGVKMIFADPEFASELRHKFKIELSSANSINIGRLLPQLFYVFSGYAQMVKNGFLKPGEELDVCVPTGNFGNIFSAYLAKQMGLPLGKLICASNDNNTSATFLTTGRFDVRNRKTKKTLSPAMDILRASNLERLLFHISGQDPEFVVSCQQQLMKNGFFEIGAELLKTLQQHFEGYSIDDAETSSQIKETAESNDYLVDPHTAVALRAEKKRSSQNNKALVFSTAHYGKFGSTVFSSLFPDRTLPDNEKVILEALSASYPEPQMPESFLQVLNSPLRHRLTCDNSLAAMKQEITQFFQNKSE